MSWASEKQVRHFLSTIEGEFSSCCSVDRMLEILANHLAVFVAGFQSSQAVFCDTQKAPSFPSTIQILDKRDGSETISVATDGPQNGKVIKTHLFEDDSWKVVAILGSRSTSIELQCDFLGNVFSWINLMKPRRNAQFDGGQNDIERERIKEELARFGGDSVPNSEFFRHLTGELDLVLSTAGLNAPQRPNRWAWIGAKPTSDDENSPIYFYQSDGDQRKPTAPELLNPEGEEGILHEVLERGFPSVIWDYQESKSWNLSRTVKERWKQFAKVNRYPHLVYVPVGERIAWQTSVAGENFYDLVTFMRSMSANFSFALLTAFQAALYLEITRYADANPGVFQAGWRDGSPAFDALWEICSRIFLHYPLPLMKMSLFDWENIRFEALDSTDNLSMLLCDAAPKVIRRALSDLRSKEHVDNVLNYGASMMGVFHTLGRPFNYLESTFDYIEENEKGITEYTGKRIKEAKREIAYSRVFSKLETENFNNLERFQNRGFDSECLTQVSGILKKLEEVEYATEVAGLMEFPLSWIFSEPHENTRITVEAEENFRYAAGVGSCSLIVAELIDNAAKYLRTDPDVPKEIGICFDEGFFTVTNPVDVGTLAAVQANIRSGSRKVGKSLNRVIALARIFNGRLTWEITETRYVRFAFHLP